jgi:hypothetical protein
MPRVYTNTPHTIITPLRTIHSASDMPSQRFNPSAASVSPVSLCRIAYADRKNHAQQCRLVIDANANVPIPGHHVPVRPFRTTTLIHYQSTLPPLPPFLTDCLIMYRFRRQRFSRQADTQSPARHVALSLKRNGKQHAKPFCASAHCSVLHHDSAIICSRHRRRQYCFHHSAMKIACQRSGAR